MYWSNSSPGLKGVFFSCASKQRLTEINVDHIPDRRKRFTCIFRFIQYRYGVVWLVKGRFFSMKALVCFAVLPRFGAVRHQEVCWGFWGFSTCFGRKFWRERQWTDLQTVRSSPWGKQKHGLWYRSEFIYLFIYFFPPFYKDMNRWSFNWISYFVSSPVL